MTRIAPERLETVLDGIVEIVAAMRGKTTSQNHNELRWGRKGSFKVDPRRRNFSDFQNGETGDAIDLIRRETGLDFPSAVVFGEKLLGLDGNVRRPADRKRKQRPKTATTVKRKPKGLNRDALNAWNSAFSLENSIAVAYFEEVRRCSIPGHHCCRFVPAMKHYLSGLIFPAIVSLLTDATTGTPLSLHMTFLAHDGRGKAPVEQPRLFWYGPLIGGCVVRLSPDDQVETGLTISEGLEDGQSLLDYGSAPVWACPNAGHMAKFPVLPGVEALTICADADANKAGEGAATKCMERWTAAGSEVTITYPHGTAKDFNEVAVARAGS